MHTVHSSSCLLEGGHPLTLDTSPTPRQTPPRLGLEIPTEQTPLGLGLDTPPCGKNDRQV